MSSCQSCLWSFGTKQPFLGIESFFLDASGPEIAAEATDFFHKIEESVESLEQVMNSLLNDSQTTSIDGSTMHMHRSTSISSGTSCPGNCFQDNLLKIELFVMKVHIRGNVYLPLMSRICAHISR